MTLFRRVLVPHDLSRHATRALKVAAELARREGGRLVVLHVLTPFYGGPGFPTPEEIAWTPTEDLVRNLRARLERVVAQALPAEGAPPVTCKVVVGEALASILEAARHADTIVMTTLGRTGLAHVLIGSVAEKVVRHAPVPVLIVRPPAARARRTRKAGGRTARR